MKPKRKQPSVERRIWYGMRKRCLNPNCKCFKNYGGRGISICERWYLSFDDFLTDVGLRPSPQYSVDRIDNMRGYEPGNVRWATRTQQGRNKRNNVVIEAFGKRMLLFDWARETGIGYRTILSRLQRGCTGEDAVSTPIGKDQGKGNQRLLTYKGESRNLVEWAAHLGITSTSLRFRLLAGWPVDLALSTGPVQGGRSKELSARIHKYANQERRDYCTA